MTLPLLWALHGWPEPDPVTTGGTGGGIAISTALWRSTIDNAFVEDLSADLVDGRVEMNIDRAITLSAKCTLRHPEKVTPYLDYLAPIVTLTYDDGRPPVTSQLGLFAVRTPPRLISVQQTTAEFEGDDLCAVLATSRYTTVDNVAAGTNVRAEIVETLAEAGITRHNLPPSDRTTEAALTYRVGTSRLDKIDALLQSIGWYTLTMDTDGRMASQPIRDIALVEPFTTVTDADLLAPVDAPPIAGEVANVVLVILDNPSQEPIVETRRNDDASSPTSTVVLGREIVREERRSDLATQADVAALADRLLQESRSYYQPAKIMIRPNPTIGVRGTVDLALSGDLEALNGRWWFRAWTTGFTPATAPLTLEINRTTDTLLGVTI